LFQQTTLLDELTVAGNLQGALKLYHDHFQSTKERDLKLKQLLLDAASGWIMTEMPASSLLHRIEWRHRTTRQFVMDPEKTNHHNQVVVVELKLPSSSNMMMMMNGNKQRLPPQNRIIQV
jgi:hypothetical protein